MPFREAIDALPNGLHDAEIRRLTIDYVERTVSCEVDIWMSMHEDENFYRSARLAFGGLEYCVIEPPNPTYPYDSGEALRVDLDERDRPDDECPKPRAGGASLCRLFVDEWNSWITICAATVELIWSGPAVNRDAPEQG